MESSKLSKTRQNFAQPTSPSTTLIEANWVNWVAGVQDLFYFSTLERRSRRGCKLEIEKQKSRNNIGKHGVFFTQFPISPNRWGFGIG